jgi:hypothetical protein
MIQLNKIVFERWYNIVLLLGVLLFFLCFNKINIPVYKHLFGGSIGLILIGISFNIARKIISVPDFHGIYSIEKIIHTTFTKILLVLGGALVCIFLFLLLIDLI